MCGGVKYVIDDVDGLQQTARVFFGYPYAKIPVIYKGKKRILVWGRREERDENSNPTIPNTGWARFNKIDSEFWQRFSPEPVLIPALEFSEKGNLDKSQWFPLSKGIFIMGLQIHQPEQDYVYVVTDPAAYGLENVHPRMPHLVHEDFTPAEEKFKKSVDLKSLLPETVQQTLF